MQRTTFLELTVYSREKLAYLWSERRVSLIIGTVSTDNFATRLSNLIWGLIKLHYGNKIHSNIPALVDGDRVITDSKEKALLFNDYFCSVYEIENADVVLPSLDVFEDVKFIDNISTQEINNLLKTS